MVMKRKTMRGSDGAKKSIWKSLLWGLLLLILKIAGIAFVVQGFILQLATGILYYGLLHYAIGTILLMITWHLHGKKGWCC